MKKLLVYIILLFSLYGIAQQGTPNFTNYGTEQGLALSSVRCGYVDKSGNLWFGTYGGGVSCYNGKSFVNFTSKDGLAHNVVFSILQDKIGNLWFGTYGGGVSCYNGNRVEAIERGDKNAQLTQQGLKRENGKLVKSFVNFTAKDGLANDNVFSILEDKSGNIWFGTNGGGVSCYNPSASLRTGSNSFTNFTTAQGLADDVVYAMQEDKKTNTLWLGTNLGLTAIYTQIKLGEKNDKVKVAIYNKITGYPIKDVNGNAMCLDTHGVLWVGCGDDKLIRFDPSALNINTKPLALQIQSVKVNSENICWYNLISGNEASSVFQTPSPKEKVNCSNDSLALLWEMQSTLGKQISIEELDSMRHRFSDIKFDGITKFYPLPTHLELPYIHNNVSFEFVAIEPAMQAQVKYQYKLEGYDEDWSPVTKKTSANFGNIHEGTYVFKLKCLSPFGVWSETSYEFKVLPPWFRTWWMYTVYGLIAVMIVWLVVWWNGRKLKARAIELTEEVRKATKVIVEQKEVVEGQKQHIEEKQKEVLDSIHYAKRIQVALLPHEKYIERNLNRLQRKD